MDTGNTCQAHGYLAGVADSHYSQIKLTRTAHTINTLIVSAVLMSLINCTDLKNKGMCRAIGTSKKRELHA